MRNCVNVFQAITEVLTVAALFGQHWKEVGLPHPIPIACVGCGDADRVRGSLVHLYRRGFQEAPSCGNAAY